MNRVSYILIFLLTSCDGCKDDPQPKAELEKLPLATQTGKHTFGCLLNEQAWVTKTTIDSWAFYQEGVLSIGSSLVTKDINQGMGFVIRDSNLSESKYILNDSIYRYGNFGDDNTKCTYSCYDGRGELTITKLDQAKRIISGTFYFTVSNANCDTIRVSDGRFDLTYAN